MFSCSSPQSCPSLSSSQLLLTGHQGGPDSAIETLLSEQRERECLRDPRTSNLSQEKRKPGKKSVNCLVTRHCKAKVK